MMSIKSNSIKYPRAEKAVLKQSSRSSGMKETALFAVLLLITIGVSGQASESQKLSALEGDTVTLHTDITEIHNVDLMMWIYTYGPESSIIAKLNGKSHAISLYDADDGRFGDRLLLDNQTGSLSIADIRTKHSGDYQLRIISIETSYKTFSLTVYDVFFAGVTNRKEGEPVTLHTGVNDIQKHSAVVWKFDPLGLNSFLADLNITVHKSSYSADERWRHRLKLDERTGALSISDSRSTDTGVYQLQVTSSKETFYRRYNLYIDVPEPGPSSALSASLIFICLLIVAGVAVGVYYYRRKYSRLKDEMKTKEVLKGDSVTLHTGVTDLQKYHKIRWRFGPKGSRIAEINARTTEYPDERFKGRLQIDSKTGDLTIRDVQITQSGDYQLKLYTDSVRENKSKRFKVIVHEDSLRFSEGENIHLHTGLSKLNTDDQVCWTFGSKRIANNYGVSSDDDRFKDRLELDHKNGSLQITNCRSTDSGVYFLQIKSKSNVYYKTFRVTVWLDTIKCAVGDCVTLNTGIPELEADAKILWTHGDNDTCIAKINRATSKMSVYEGNDARFRDRLQLDPQTGSLSIFNISTAHSDVYTLQISSGSRGTKSKRFAIIAEENKVCVVEGDRAELNPDVGELQTDALILWQFGPENNLIAKADSNGPSTYEGADGRFTGRLELDPHTATLSITNTTNTHSGLYKLKIMSSRETKYQQFRVKVSGSSGRETNNEHSVNNHPEDESSCLLGTSV